MSGIPESPSDSVGGTGGGQRLVDDAVRAEIGRSVTYRSPEPLGRASIRYYALAIGADPDRWRDEAPPTLVCETTQLTGRRDRDEHAYLGHTWAIPFPEPVVMIRGGNDYRFEDPVRHDDTIVTTWTIADIAERTDRNGLPLAVVTARADFATTDGRQLATNTETLLYRPTGRPAGPDPAPPEPVPEEPVSAAADPQTGAETAAAGSAEELAVGDRLADLVRTLELADLVAYGAATWDWHRLHYDPEVAGRAGFARPVVDGQMLGALLAEQAVRAAGPTGRLTRLHFRNRAPVLAGATVVCRARVASVDGDAVALDQEVLVDGRPAVGPAGAELRLGSGDR